MALNREGIYAALLARLQEYLGTDVASYSRRYASWDDTPPAAMPALMLLQEREAAAREHLGTPLIWTLRCALWLYAKDDGTASAVIATQLNTLLENIETALEVQPDEPRVPGAPFYAQRDVAPAGTTLGGLCYSCAVTGEVEFLYGEQGHTGMLIIPIEIVASA